jgi:hypothetical protein
MLELLDELDNEYTRINSLNRWEKGAQGSEIVALTAELSTLKKSFAKLQQIKLQQSVLSGTIKKVDPHLSFKGTLQQAIRTSQGRRQTDRHHRRSRMEMVPNLFPWNWHLK